MRSLKRFLPLSLLAITVSLSASAQWSVFCSGTTDGYIMDLINHNNDIYACGSITEIGGTSVNSVAKWDGSQWQPVGSSFTEWVHKLESIGTDLYATPYNSTTDSNHLYKWDGSQWLKYGKGFYLTTTNLGMYHASSLYDVVEYNGQLVVCGEFDVAGNKHVDGIATWDGTDWNALGTGLADPINGSNIYPHKMLVQGNDLYVVGGFKKAGGVSVNGIARWDGTQWHAMGAGFDAAVYGIEVYKGEIYACGEFTQSGSNNVMCIAKWNGNDWVNAGVQLSTNIPGYKAFGHTLKAVNNNLYVAGGFDLCVDMNMQIIPGKNVLEFDGNTWYEMDGGTDRDLEGIVGYNNDVLFGGDFNTAGTVAVNSMALWHSTVSVSGITDDNNKVSLYPNPVYNELQIDFQKPQQVSGLVIVDIAGKMQYQTKAVSAKTVINISNLNAGTYFIKVTDKEKQEKTYSFTKL